MTEQTNNRARLDVRLRKTSPQEADVIDALDKWGNYYGGKSELLKTWIIAGFEAIKRNVATVDSSAGSEVAISSLANTLLQDQYTYLATKIYLGASAKVKDRENRANPAFISSYSAGATPEKNDEATLKATGNEVVAEPGIPKKRDWSKFSNIAGTQSEGGKSKGGEDTD